MIFGDKFYYQSLKKLIAFDAKGLKEAFEYIDLHRQNGYFVGYVKYEAKDIFLQKNIVSKKPLLYFEHFASRDLFCPQKGTWHTFYPHLKAQIDFSCYAKKITSIKEAIARGDTYQTNFTYPLEVATRCDAKNVFESLLSNQDTPYKAFITNEFETILSFSPELFFQILPNGSNDLILARPMKGTIQRGKNQKEDLEYKEFLKNDLKNQSENVMIVDLLRNDLSRIASRGSVQVSKLFEIQTHLTLHQMISEIRADIPKNMPLYKIFEALFPCGSITGAPKIKTMEIISELEKKQRDVYCGAIGVIERDRMVFNVPIRTLYQKAQSKNYVLNVGGGIVWESKVREEWKESKLKSIFIYPKIDFCLVETMRVQDFKILDFSLHLKRLKKSADYFGFKISDSLEMFQPQKNGILRILIDKKGHIFETYLPFLPSESKKILLQNNHIDCRNDFLYHKTTYRPWYEESMQKIKTGSIFDEIYFNQDGALTEGARSNIMLEINGELFTPPIASGLLAGVCRQKLLTQGICKEKILYLSDLRNADKIYCINSVRGITLVDIQE